MKPAETQKPFFMRHDFCYVANALDFQNWKEIIL